MTVNFVSVTDSPFNALGDGVTDDAPAFRAALAAIPNGGTLYVPTAPVAYLMNSYTAGTDAILSFASFPNKAVTIQGEGWSLESGGSFSFGSGKGPVGSVIVIGNQIPSSVSFLHQAPTDLVIGGVAYKDFAVVASTGAYGTPQGNHGFYLDGTAAANGYIENLLMENVFIDNMASGYSIFVNGAGNAQGVLAGAIFRNSKFMNFYAPGFGDSNAIERNVIGANATNDARNIGVYWWNVSGATNTRVRDNDMVNFNGMIICDGAIKPIIDGNEFEQSAGSANSAGSLVWMRGNVSPIDTPTITNNSVSQNASGQTYAPIFLQQCNSARVSGNRCATPSSYPHIQIATTSAHTLVEADNTSWAGGTPQAAALVSDLGIKSVLRGSTWTAYTPIVSASSGSFSSVTASGAYQLRDTKTLDVRFDITITAVGTAAGAVQATIPPGFAANAYQSVCGREVNVTGRGLSADITVNSSTMQITDAAGFPIIGAGYRLILSGTIEIQ